jgi:2-polyprenyl-3-methyl-5-hydroxy-6-metoxy-1,4-benzoquinol methylase
MSKKGKGKRKKSKGKSARTERVKPDSSKPKKVKVAQLEARIAALEDIIQQIYGDVPEPEATALEQGPSSFERWVKQRLQQTQVEKISQKLTTPDFDYYLFETMNRGSEELIRSRQEVYLPHFEGCENILDIGCGRGELLELLEENFISAHGVDLDRDNVLSCQERDLNVIQADAFQHLLEVPQSSLGGVFIGQVVEHMDNQQLLNLCNLCYRALRPGAMCIIETINPHCVYAHQWYWLDPSHVRLVPPDLLKMDLEICGFEDCETLFLSPVSEEERMEGFAVDEESPKEIQEMQRKLQANFTKLNQLLYCHQDYAIVARVPEDKTGL